TLDSRRGAARACPGDDWNTAVDLSACSPGQLHQLGVAQVHGFARAPAYDDAVRAVGQMKIEESLPSGKIDCAIRPHGRDDGHQTPGEQANSGTRTTHAARNNIRYWRRGGAGHWVRKRGPLPVH